MKSLMKTTLLAAMLLAGVSLFGAQISVGIRIGQPPPPRVVRVLPPRPSPEFVWIEGYWYPVGKRYRWHEGYWTRPTVPEGSLGGTSSREAAAALPRLLPFLGMEALCPKLRDENACAPGGLPYPTS
jgi:hypothetical protein